MHRKGQSEDIFNDLIPSIILIVITIVIIAINGASEQHDVLSISGDDLASLRRLDVITYMRMPVSGYGHFAEFIINLNSGEDSARSFTEGIDPYVCNDNLQSELANNIGKSYRQWSLRVFNPVSGDIVFACYSDDSFFIDAYSLSTVDVPEALYGSSMYLDFEQAYLMPLGMVYLNTTLPTLDPANNLFVKMGVLQNE